MIVGTANEANEGPRPGRYRRTASSRPVRAVWIRSSASAPRPKYRAASASARGRLSATIADYSRSRSHSGCCSWSNSASVPSSRGVMVDGGWATRGMTDSEGVHPESARVLTSPVWSDCHHHAVRAMAWGHIPAHINRARPAGAAGPRDDDRGRCCNQSRRRCRTRVDESSTHPRRGRVSGYYSDVRAPPRPPRTPWTVRRLKPQPAHPSLGAASPKPDPGLYRLRQRVRRRGC